MTIRELLERAKGVARRVNDSVGSRDVLTAAGAFLIAQGTESFVPGAGSIVLGVIVLYVALWHGPLTAYLLRETQPKE